MAVSCIWGRRSRLHISCLHCTDFGMHIAIGSGTVGIRSSCSGTAYIGPVLITATPAIPVYATLEPANLLARRFAVSASSARLDKSTPKRNSFEVSFAYCWVVQMTR